SGEQWHRPEQRPAQSAEHVSAWADPDQPPHHQPDRGAQQLPYRGHIRTPAAASKPENRLVGSAASSARGPYSTTWPSSITAIWSTRANEESRWAINTPVRPRSNRVTAWSMVPSVAGSNRLDASSNTISPGSVRNAR